MYESGRGRTKINGNHAHIFVICFFFGVARGWQRTHSIISFSNCNLWFFTAFDFGAFVIKISAHSIETHFGDTHLKIAFYYSHFRICTAHATVFEKSGRAAGKKLQAATMRLCDTKKKKKTNAFAYFVVAVQRLLSAELIFSKCFIFFSIPLLFVRILYACNNTSAHALVAIWNLFVHLFASFYADVFSMVSKQF